MYVPPRPAIDDDPLLPLRIGAMAVIGLCAIEVFRPSMAPLMAVFPVMIVSNQRGAFNPRGIFLGCAVYGVLAWVLTPVFAWTHNLPVPHMILCFAIFFVGIHMTRQAGAGPGMLIVMITLMTSVLSIKGEVLAHLVRDAVLQTVVLAAVAIPVLYVLIPTRTSERRPITPVRAPDSAVAGSLIRAALLTAMTFTLFTWLPTSDIVLSISAVYVMMFPDHDEMFRRTFERIVATYFGSILGASIALVVGWNGHFIVLAGLVFLFSVYLGDRMFTGWRQPAIYQYIIATMLVILELAFSTNDWSHAAVLRVGLTIFGSGTAAIFAAALETALWRWQQRRIQGVG